MGMVRNGNPTVFKILKISVAQHLYVNLHLLARLVVGYIILHSLYLTSDK